MQSRLKSYELLHCTNEWLSAALSRWGECEVPLSCSLSDTTQQVRYKLEFPSMQIHVYEQEKISSEEEIYKLWRSHSMIKSNQFWTQCTLEQEVSSKSFQSSIIIFNFLKLTSKIQCLKISERILSLSISVIAVDQPSHRFTIFWIYMVYISFKFTSYYILPPLLMGMLIYSQIFACTSSHVQS